MSMDVKSFIHLEDSIGVFEDDINGFKYWQYIRFSLFRMFNVVDEKSDTKKTVSHNLFSYLKKLNYSYNSSPYRKKGSIDCLCLCTQRKSLIDGKFVDLYTNDAYKYIKKKYNSIIVDYDDGFFYNNPNYDYSMNSIYSSIHIKKFLLKPFILNNNVKLSIKRKSKYIADYIVENKILDNNSETIYQNVYSLILNNYILYKCAKPTFERLIRKKKIKFISVICHYSPMKMVLLEVSNQNNVETLEFQHGIMGEGHIAYNYYQNSPVFFPKNLLLFSEYWKITTLFPKTCKLFIVGFPFLEEYKKQHENVKLKKDTILFISQAKDSEGLYEFANEVYDYFKKRSKNIEILYKLHPKENIGDYILNPNIKIVEGKNNIYDLLLVSNMQIGVFSTAIYEGLAFGLQTLIYKINASANRMKYLVENNYAEYIDNPAQVFEAYYSDKNSRSIHSFYEVDSYNKTVKVLSEIIDKKLNEQ